MASTRGERHAEGQHQRCCANHHASVPHPGCVRHTRATTGGNASAATADNHGTRGAYGNNCVAGTGVGLRGWKAGCGLQPAGQMNGGQSAQWTAASCPNSWRQADPMVSVQLARWSAASWPDGQRAADPMVSSQPTR
eukprot:355315-Chlamydomonas_euryale.AAC.3